MKYKTIATAILALIGVFGAVCSLAQPALAVICPPHSLRNQSDEPVEVSDISSVAQCNLPAEETAADGSKKDMIWYIKTIINVVLGMVGIIAVVVIIIGGISFITSQGDPGKVTKARNTILYGAVGVVVALLAFAIVNFVLNSHNSSSAATTTPPTQNSSSTQKK